MDDLKYIVTDAAGQSLDDVYVVFDIETTGFSAENDRIIEIGAVRVEQGEITDKFSVFVNPRTPIPFEIEKLTGINDEMVMNEPTIEEILPKFLEFCKGAVMVAHNAGFDMSFIRKNSERQDLPCEFTVVDTVPLARLLLPQLNRYKLDTVAKALNISLENHHRAVDVYKRQLLHVIADAHIYDRHVDIIKELIARPEHPAPKVWLNPEVKDFYAFTTDDLHVEDYETEPQIRDIPIAV